MLDDLGIVGISWRQQGAEGLSQFSLDEDNLEERLKGFARRAELAELVYLSTCNRVELIFARQPDAPYRDIRRLAFEFLTGGLGAPGMAERALKAWAGEGAAEHLFLVAAGLDSACLGEPEIAGQVRASHDAATAMGLGGARLNLLFEEALKFAAAVRGQTRLGSGRLSLAEIAVDLVKERTARAPGCVALVGVSPMTRRAARSLAKAGVPMLIVNRSADPARELAGLHAAGHMPLDRFRREPPALAALLSSTGAPTAVLDAAALERIAAAAGSGPGPLLIDMAVPADIDPDACRDLDLERVSMDRIVAIAERNQALRQAEATEARGRVDEALDRLRDRYAERLYGPLLGTLQKRYRYTAEQGLSRLFKKELQGLGAEEQAAITAWAGALARRFAHIPCMGLRGLLQTGPEGSLEAFLDGLDTEFADELRGALERDNAPRRVSNS